MIPAKTRPGETCTYPVQHQLAKPVHSGLSSIIPPTESETTTAENLQNPANTGRDPSGQTGKLPTRIGWFPDSAKYFKQAILQKCRRKSTTMKDICPIMSRPYLHSYESNGTIEEDTRMHIVSCYTVECRIYDMATKKCGLTSVRRTL